MAKFYIEEQDDGELILYAEFKPGELTRESAPQLALLKWETLKKLVIEHGYIHCGDCSTCAYCLVYDLCQYCPIRIAGFDACQGTPYVKYDLLGASRHCARDERAIKLIDKEIIFLKGIASGKIKARPKTRSIE